MNGFSVDEGDSGSQSVGISVVLNGPANGNEAFTISTSDGSATAGSDYNALTQNVSFSAGQSARTVFLNILGDTGLEPDETIIITVTNIQNFTMTSRTATITITNDDTAAVVPSVVSVPTTQTVSEGGPKYAVTTTMTNPAGRTCRVSYSTTNGTAGAGDFSGVIGELNTHVAQATATQTFEIFEDLLVEGDESFTVTMSLDTTFSDPTCQLGNSTMTVTITDNDSPPPPPTIRSLSISDAARLEGNSGTTHLAFTLALSGVANGNETVRVSTQSGTASTISDYVAVTDQLVSFAAGQTTQIVDITINGDTAVEPNETFSVVVGTPINVTISDGAGQGTVTNDDSPPPPPPSGPVLISVNDASVVEGNSGKTPLVFKVTLSRASTESVRVKLETNDSQAARSSDYVFLETRLTFAPGETEKLVTVQIRGDKKHERDERFYLVLDSPKNAKIDKDHRTGKGIILNDDTDDDD